MAQADEPVARLRLGQRAARVDGRLRVEHCERLRAGQTVRGVNKLAGALHVTSVAELARDQLLELRIVLR